MNIAAPKTATATTVALKGGLDATLIEVGVSCSSRGLPNFSGFGREAAATFPRALRVFEPMGANFRRTTETAPAPGGADLAIAMAALSAGGRVGRSLDDVAFWGEVSIEGDVLPVRGAVVAAKAARDAGIARLIVSSEAMGYDDFDAIEGIEVVGARDLHDTVRIVEGRSPGASFGGGWRPIEHPDMSDCKGMGEVGVRIARAVREGRGILLIGRPGSGTTMLARRVLGFLPEMSAAEREQVALVKSMAGLTGLPVARPFRAPHSSSSLPGMLGGGAGLPRPGEVTLAHGGVLFLDELDMRPLGALQQTLRTVREGRSTLARAASQVEMPAAPQLVMAMAPYDTPTPQAMKRWRKLMASIHDSYPASSCPLVIDLDEGTARVSTMRAQGDAAGFEEVDTRNGPTWSTSECLKVLQKTRGEKS